MHKLFKPAILITCVLISWGLGSLSVKAVSFGECETPVEFGVFTECALSVAGEVDELAFEAEANDLIYVVVRQFTGSFRPAISIVDEDGTTIAGCSAHEQPAVRVECRIPRTGSYRLTVQDFYRNGTGDYRFYIQRANEPSHASVIHYSDSLLDSLEISDQVDTYILDVDSVDTMFVRSVRISGELEMKITIRNDNGNIVCQDDEYLVVLNVFCNVSPGRYYIEFSHRSLSGATGGYRLSLQRLNNPVNAPMVNIGIPLAESIEKGLELDYYQFAATAQDIMNIRVTRRTGNLISDVLVRTESGELLCRQDDVYVEMNCTIPETGIYSIWILDNSILGRTGSYTLGVQSLNDPQEAIPLRYGFPYSGVLTEFRELDAYTFNAFENASIRVTMQRLTGGIDPTTSIFDASGQIVCSASNEVMDCVVPSAGRYSIFVYQHGFEATGGYRITLGCNTATCGTNPPLPNSLFLPITRR